MFWGKGDVFSNFHPAKFTIKGIDFNCVEQCMMYAKAKNFGDNEIAARILKEKIPNEMKKLGRLVNGFNEEKWISIREKVVYVACREKFSQNKHLMDELLSTGDLMLVEASPSDKIWGIGLSADDPNATDESKWRGQNLLGKALMRVRKYCYDLSNRGVLLVNESLSPDYAPRTWYNARSAGLTLAIAADFNTAGERLTHRAAAERFFKIKWGEDLEVATKSLIDKISEMEIDTINIAGNGIYTFAQRGVSQEEINKYVFELLSGVLKEKKISKIFTGGQTGMDMAGAIAAYALGVDVEVTLPKGFRQRGADKVDFNNKKENVEELIRVSAKKLNNRLSPKPQ